MKFLHVVLSVALVFVFGVNIAKGEDMFIQKGRKVSFNYTLTVEDKVVDSSQDRSPLQYTHGSGEIMPGLEKELEGLKAGEEKSVVLSPEEAYGPSNPEAFREVPRSSLPADMQPQVGMMLQAQSSDGSLFPVKITEVKDDTVIMDFNHPLAGKTLKFDIKVVSVE